MSDIKSASMDNLSSGANQSIHNIESLDMSLVRKPETINELGIIDITALQSMCSQFGDRVWQQEDQVKENKFAIFHNTQHIIFRFIEGNRDPRIFYSNPIWTVWQNVLLPAMHVAIKSFQFTDPVFPKVMLAKLQSNSCIDEHIDANLATRYVHKIHIPLVTNAQVHYIQGGVEYHLSQGKAYELNNMQAHGVWNNSQQHRIHLIFEVYDQQSIKGNC